jgi:predicted ATPase
VSVLIGRNQELNTLENGLGVASRGSGRCIFLTGEAGIGKSRLIEELRRQATSGNFTILQGNCFEQETSFPYAPWIDALRAYFTPLDATQIKELLGPLAPEFIKLLPELALLIPAIQPSPPLEPLAEKYRFFESLARFIVSLAKANPLLMILEDLHWSDESSLELLHFFARRISALPILLVGTYRSEEILPRLSYHLAEFNRERLVQEIRLVPLMQEEVAQMMRARLKAEHHSNYRLDDLVHLTEGNPFFIEEILKSLIDRDARIRQTSDPP